jgi:hypothetical protein
MSTGDSAAGAHVVQLVRSIARHCAYTDSMNRFPITLVLCPWLALSALSQTTPVPAQPLSQVQQYLGLSDDQVKTILQNNSGYDTFSFQQQQQIQQAQIQIAAETAKAQLDPMALGMLYAAIETSCRGLRDKAAAAQQQNISVLTDTQKAKLNVLNDAIKLGPTISEAESGNLLGSAGSPPFLFNSGSFSGFIAYGGFLSGGVSGCSSPFPGAIIPAQRTSPVTPTGTPQSGALGSTINR